VAEESGGEGQSGWVSEFFFSFLIERPGERKRPSEIAVEWMSIGIGRERKKASGTKRLGA
jgi:hypothetical protein